MKIYDMKVSKGIGVFSAALFAIIFYLILDIIFNIAQSFVDPTGEAYNTAFGIIEFIAATLYWILINFIYFSKEGRTGAGAIATYLIFTILPITVFAAITSAIVYFTPTTEFTLSWNLITWIIAPTLFWFLPFSFVYFAFGYYISIPLYMGIVILYIVCIEFVGIILGLARRSHVLEKEEAIRRQRERHRRAQREPQAVFDEMQLEQTIPVAENTAFGQEEDIFIDTNPFKDRTEGGRIIYTESFEVIDDDEPEEGEIVEEDEK